MLLRKGRSSWVVWTRRNYLVLLLLYVEIHSFAPHPLRHSAVGPSLFLSKSFNSTSTSANGSSAGDNDEVDDSSSPNGQNGLYYEERAKMKLQWCNDDFCKEVLREKVVGARNQIILRGPATGQVIYNWEGDSGSINVAKTTPVSSSPNVLLLIRPGDDELMRAAAEAIQQLNEVNVQVLLDPSTAARVKFYFGVDCDNVHLYEAQPLPGFGEGLSDEDDEEYVMPEDFDQGLFGQCHPTGHPSEAPDLICTLGGDGLLMHAGMMFQGPVPPILCVAGGSLGFLTPFSVDEMVEALLIALGMQANDWSNSNQEDDDILLDPPVLSGAAFSPSRQPILDYPVTKKPMKATFGIGNRIFLSIRMRLQCSILNKDGSLRARYNVLNEVVVDRGSSPYLAAIECFCDDSHLTTVQADGVIFATPTGSTAYSLAAGSSVVHPAVPCILLTPICPHVLSFRSMVFPDHVVLRCYVPSDARAPASVAFDGKHRQELRRGDSLQVRMSPYPIPTINRRDQTADWLGNLKSNFNFNSRPRQRPL